MSRPGMMTKGIRKRHYGRMGLVPRLAFAVVAGSGLASPVFGQCSYEATIIEGPICSDGFPAAFGPFDLDENGVAVGSTVCFLLPFASIWMGDGLAERFPDSADSRAFAIFDPDHVVGSQVPPGASREVARYWLNGQGQNLPLLPGANTSQALGINGDLVIVGDSNNTVSGPHQAFRWEDGQIEALQLPLGPASSAVDMNHLHQITGWMGPSLLESRGFVSTNGATVTIPLLPNGVSTRPFALNNLGHAVGYGVLNVEGIGETRHAIYWDGLQVVDLGALPERERSQARDLNDVRQIVGDSTVPEPDAVFWQDGNIYALQPLIVSDIGGRDVQFAKAINNAGQILVQAEDLALLLTPIGSAPGDIDNNCIVSVSDLVLLLGEWGNSNSFADTNGDGMVNVTDLLQLLSDWG